MSQNLKDYFYTLPQGLIAQTPAEPRDSSRLMVLHRRTQKIEHRRFTDIVDYFDASDLIIANNTKVLKARLIGNRILEGENHDIKIGGKIEMLLLEKLAPRTWEGAFHSSAKQEPGLRFQVPCSTGTVFGTIIRGTKESTTGTVVVEFNVDPVDADAGELPLPHYMERAPNEQDHQNYQTVYSKNLGSAAAPTAGLHFTDRVLQGIQNKGAKWAEVTLHVGLGTFRPVKVQNISEHKMHSEKYWIEPGVAQLINEHKKSNGRITAIGTTSMRTLESAYDPKNKCIVAGSSQTEIFIYPGGHEIKAVDRLLTNFHLPESTLLMLVSAFAGREFILKAYQEAVDQKYRFFSYGDAMLIL